MGFFWGCSCCGPDYWVYTKDELRRYTWGQVTPSVNVDNTFDWSAEISRRQMIADGTHLWITGPKSSQCTMLKFDADGAIVDTVNFGAFVILNGFARGPDGNFVSAGVFSTPTERVRAFDSSGTRLWGWESSFPSGTGFTCDMDADGNSLVVTTTFERVVKLDSGGTKLWDSNTTDISGVSATGFNCGRFDLDGNVVLGESSPVANCKLAKFDEDGNHLWTVAAATTRMAIQYITILPDNRIAIIGIDRTAAAPGGSRFAVYDEDGNELHNAFRAGEFDNMIACNAEGRFILGGTELPTPLNGVLGILEDDYLTSGGFPEFPDDTIGGALFVTGLITAYGP